MAERSLDQMQQLVKIVVDKLLEIPLWIIFLFLVAGLFAAVGVVS